MDLTFTSVILLLVSRTSSQDIYGYDYEFGDYVETSQNQKENENAAAGVSKNRIVENWSLKCEKKPNKENSCIIPFKGLRPRYKGELLPNGPKTFKKIMKLINDELTSKTCLALESTDGQKNTSPFLKFTNYRKSKPCSECRKPDNSKRPSSCLNTCNSPELTCSSSVGLKSYYEKEGNDQILVPHEIKCNYGKYWSKRDKVKGKGSKKSSTQELHNNIKRELGQALGLIYETHRPDRDSYIKVNKKMMGTKSKKPWSKDTYKYMTNNTFPYQTILSSIHKGFRKNESDDKPFRMDYYVNVNDMPFDCTAIMLYPPRYNGDNLYDFREIYREFCNQLGRTLLNLKSGDPMEKIYKQLEYRYKNKYINFSAMEIYQLNRLYKCPSKLSKLKVYEGLNYDGKFYQMDAYSFAYCMGHNDVYELLEKTYPGEFNENYFFDKVKSDNRWRYTCNDMRALLKQDFEVEKISDDLSVRWYDNKIISISSNTDCLVNGQNCCEFQKITGASEPCNSRKTSHLSHLQRSSTCASSTSKNKCEDNYENLKEISLFYSLSRSIHTIQDHDGNLFKNFQEISANLFLNLVKLKELTISENSKLKIIRDKAFYTNRKLETLTITSCSLEFIRPLAFNGLVSLQKLSLYGNAIATVPVSLRHNLVPMMVFDENDDEPIYNRNHDNPYPKLETLDLSLNNIVKIEEIFAYKDLNSSERKSSDLATDIDISPKNGNGNKHQKCIWQYSHDDTSKNKRFKSKSGKEHGAIHILDNLINLKILNLNDNELEVLEGIKCVNSKSSKDTFQNSLQKIVLDNNKLKNFKIEGIEHCENRKNMIISMHNAAVNTCKNNKKPKKEVPTRCDCSRADVNPNGDSINFEYSSTDYFDELDYGSYAMDYGSYADDDQCNTGSMHGTEFIYEGSVKYCRIENCAYIFS